MQPAIRREKLYLVSYSIPLGCMVALLLVGIASAFPNLDKQAIAVEIGDTVESTNAVARGVMPSTVSLNITGDRNAEVETGTGVTTYRSHAVNVTVNDVQEYYLKISGTTELTPPTGGTAIPGVGTTGVKGSEMLENTWGYAWTSDGGSVDSEDDMTFVSIPSTATSLAIPNLVDGNASFSGKLSFGAKFAATSVLGNYTSGVQLTLIATPKSNTGSNHGFWYNENGAPTGLDSGTASMQDAAPDFCVGNNQVGIGWTVQLEDNRDGKTYTIVKLKDGNCWMQENLALEADPEKYPDGMTLAPGDTDLPGDTTWVLPKSTTTWNTKFEGDNNGNKVAQVATGSTSMSGWKQGYGNYYSWTAATAETGSNVAGGIAAGSICPKGWKLPTGSGGTASYNQFQNLFGSHGEDLGSNTQARFDAVTQTPYLFSAAGSYDGSLSGAGTYGNYWSRTFSGDTSAFYLSFDPSPYGGIYPGTNGTGGRYRGYSVRCVQSAGNIWENNAGTSGAITSGVELMQDITTANFTEKYCSRSQDSLVSVESTLKLRDYRDSKEYTIVKLKDGNCWMQENLALSGQITLTDGDSDLDSEVSTSFTLPAGVTRWTSDLSGNSMTQVRVGSTSLSNWQQGYGNYYSWCAATANTCNSTADGTNAPSSICPKGWKLPDGQQSSSTNQFLALFGTNGDNLGSDLSYQEKFNKVQQIPYNLFAAGSIENSNASLSSAGTSGRYWYRTSVSHGTYARTYAYTLDFSSEFFRYRYGSISRFHGLSVRCLAEPAS